MQVIVDIADSDVKCLKNDLIDIQDWVNKAIEGKVCKCKDRMIAEWLPKLMADPAVDSVPADEVALVDLITSRVDYKDRVAREAASKEV